MLRFRIIIIIIIDGNRIDAEGAKAIGAALINNDTLIDLNLSMSYSASLLFIGENEIGAEGAKAIGAALINNCALTNLSLCMCFFA